MKQGNEQLAWLFWGGGDLLVHVEKLDATPAIIITAPPFAVAHRPLLLSPA